MKYAAILMVFVLLLSLAGVGYVYLTATVTVTATGVATLEASAQPDTFNSLRQQLEEGSVAGTVFTDTVGDDPEQYKFVTYRVQLKNNTWLDAELVELAVTPRDGDVLQLEGGSSVTLTARSGGTYEATILTGINSFVGR